MTDIVLLGPQRFDPSVGEVVASLGVRGSIATVTAGWEEREPQDDELDDVLGGRSHNLGLYLRWHDIDQRDQEFAAAERRRRDQREELQAAYLLRLHHAIETIYEVQHRIRDPHVAAVEFDDAIGVVRALDERHLDRVAELDAAFDDAVRPAEREIVASHRQAVADILRDADAVAIAGGHVAVLLWCLELLDVRAALGDRPIVAWSAGAMAVADTVVLFHDLTPHAPTHAEVYARGLGLCHGVVPLPHARRRLRIDDQRRMSVLARRFAPARCLVLDDDARYTCPDGSGDPTDGVVVTHDGRLTEAAA